MKRKNKRHDSKGTPEKSPEKPSRRSNRHSKRRRKSSSSSSSPEREKVHTKSKDAAVKDSSAKGNEKVRSYTPELVTEKVNKEVIEKNVEQEAGSSRHSSKRHSGSEAEIDKLVKKDEGGGDNEWKEDKSFWEGDEKVEVETVDNKGKEKESAGSVWKVQSANGAGGEIQKLKICRQRMAEAQEDSEDSRRSSPKRRSSRIKDLNQKGPDDCSTDDTEDQSNIDGEKTSKHKIRARTSSRNSPALLDSPKVVCDVSEDNPTRIKIHIENKSPEKIPLTSPVLSNKDKTEETGVTESSKTLETESASNVEIIDKEKETVEESNKDRSESEKKEELKDNKEPEEKLHENLAETKVELGERPNTKVHPEHNAEQEQDSTVLKIPEIITENNVEISKISTEVTEDKENNEISSDKPTDVEPVQRSSSSLSPSSRNEKESSSVNGTSDDDSNDSDESDCDGKGLKRKKRRKDGIQSAVTRQQRAATESPPRSQECESTSGKQEPEEEGEIEEGEAADEEEEKDTKSTPIASDKENTVVASQSSLSTPVEPVQRKRRWGASKTIRPPKKPVLCISTDSLKNLIPEAKPIPIEEVRLSVEEDTERDQEQEERERSNENKEAAEEIKKKEKKEVKKERERHRDKEKVKDEKKVRDREKREKEPTKPVTSEKPSTDKVNRRICVLSEDARKLVRSPSPARHRPSSVLFITNLVRPFTVPQLRNLLARTGKIAENGFWIDKIKSKCYVQYTDEEAAIETRHALHGVRWPVSNPRTLCVEFASYDDMAVAQALSEETEPIPRKAEPLKVDHSVEGWLADQARINDRSQRRVVREWDVGKPAHPDEELDVRPSRPGYEDIRDRERERDREIDRDRDRRSKKERSHRSRTPDMHEPPARKPRRKDEDAPAKLLDDLFRKTKTSPCIYWLPLTAEQIVVKEEMRRQHMAEHERRYAEIRKAEQAARKDRDRRRK
ncbi:apoptotic chromatin condensation inducer acinus isoform X2 [Lycorma delicatula]|uniref:apoptotic chromatin condensation inducer acinus isoform X2 n=1 Tax=Lycorma delicatula TaxID=130591 RepID=UPI003F51803B